MRLALAALTFLLFACGHDPAPAQAPAPPTPEITTEATEILPAELRGAYRPGVIDSRAQGGFSPLGLATERYEERGSCTLANGVRHPYGPLTVTRKGGTLVSASWVGRGGEKITLRYVPPNMATLEIVSASATYTKSFMIE